MEDNSPVHDEVPSPFWAEGQTSPDQLQNTEKEKRAIKLNKAETGTIPLFLVQIWAFFLAG